jgi:hypothetical protein
MIGKIVNFVGFQSGWFACVLGAAAGCPWLGLVVVAGVVALHLALRRPRGPELRLLLCSPASSASRLKRDSAARARCGWSPCG